MPRPVAPEPPAPRGADTGEDRRGLGRAWRMAAPVERPALAAAFFAAEAARGGDGTLIYGFARFDLRALAAGAKQAIAVQPDNVAALRCLAWCLNRAGNFAAAAACLRRALAARPDLSHDSRRELARLALLREDAPWPMREADWRLGTAQLRPLPAASADAQRAAAEGRVPDRDAFEAALATANAAALAEAAQEPAAARVIGLLRAAGTVAIVGNGASLTGAGAGAAIDRHDVVLRFNYPLMRGFEADVGRRCDVMMLSNAKRRILPTLLAREAGHARIPALVVEGRPAAGPEADPPALPQRLVGALGDLGYARPTVGFAGILLVTLLLGRKARLFGFDFFAPGLPGHYFGAAAAAITHELAYERWFVRRVLPAIRPEALAPALP